MTMVTLHFSACPSGSSYFRRGLANMTKISQESLREFLRAERSRARDIMEDYLPVDKSVLLWNKSGSELIFIAFFAGIYACPSVVFDFALIVKRKDLCKQDLKGNLPLHVALSSSPYPQD